jgi:hypothetical protein
LCNLKNKNESCKKHITFAGLIIHQLGKKKRQVWVPLFHGNKKKKNKTLQQQLQSKNPRTIATTATKMTPGTRDFEKENWGGKKKKK